MVPAYDPRNKRIRHGPQGAHQHVEKRIERHVVTGALERGQADILRGCRVMSVEELVEVIHGTCNDVECACAAFGGSAPYVLDGYDVAAAEEVVDMFDEIEQRRSSVVA